LRFESFSMCNGVYARLDFERIEGDVRDVGSTNVDFNATFQHSLSAVRRDELVHLAIGADEVTLGRLSGSVSERRVRLPDRWPRGFAEVALIQHGLQSPVELDKLRTRRFLSQLARYPTRDEAWLTPSAGGYALAEEPGAGGTFIAGQPDDERPRQAEQLGCFGFRQAHLPPSTQGH
jgi:hypothetical protein